MAGLAAKVAQTQRLMFTPAGMRKILVRVLTEAKAKDVPPIANSVTGGDGIISGMGKRGRRLTSGYEVLNDHQGVLRPKPAGPWALVTFGSKGPYPVPKRKKRVILNTPQGPRVATRDHPIIHPKVPGKGAWTKVTRETAQHTGRRADEQTQAALRQVW